MRISDWSSDVCSSDLLDVETELDRIEPQPSEEIRGAQLFGAQSRPAISDQKFRKSGVGEHRHMTEYVVEHIGFLAIADLLGRAKKIGGGEAAIDRKSVV